MGKTDDEHQFVVGLGVGKIERLFARRDGPRTSAKIQDQEKRTTTTKKPTKQCGKNRRRTLVRRRARSRKNRATRATLCQTDGPRTSAKIQNQEKRTTTTKKPTKQCGKNRRRTPVRRRPRSRKNRATLCQTDGPRTSAKIQDQEKRTTTTKKPTKQCGKNRRRTLVRRRLGVGKIERLFARRMDRARQRKYKTRRNVLLQRKNRRNSVGKTDDERQFVVGLGVGKIERESVKSANRGKML